VKAKTKGNMKNFSKSDVELKLIIKWKSRCLWVFQNSHLPAHFVVVILSVMSCYYCY